MNCKPIYRTTYESKTYEFETLKEAHAKMVELMTENDNDYATTYVEEVWPYASFIVASYF